MCTAAVLEVAGCFQNVGARDSRSFCFDTSRSAARGIAPADCASKLHPPRRVRCFGGGRTPIENYIRGNARSTTAAGGSDVFRKKKYTWRKVQTCSRSLPRLSPLFITTMRACKLARYLDTDKFRPTYDTVFSKLGTKQLTSGKF